MLRRWRTHAHAHPRKTLNHSQPQTPTHPHQLTAARAEAFYAEHQGRPLFPGLVEFMASGPAVAAVLARPDAVRAWRALVGPTNPLEARSAAPKSLRALYGADGTHNAVHGSDSAASAAREIKFFFPRLAAGAGVGAAGDPRDEAARAGVMRGLQPTLVKALTALAKAKPASGRVRVFLRGGSGLVWDGSSLVVRAQQSGSRPRPIRTSLSLPAKTPPG
jgi:nucleoside diphosphate kinase